MRGRALVSGLARSACLDSYLASPLARESPSISYQSTLEEIPREAVETLRAGSSLEPSLASQTRWDGGVGVDTGLADLTTSLTLD